MNNKDFIIKFLKFIIILTFLVDDIIEKLKK